MELVFSKTRWNTPLRHVVLPAVCALLLCIFGVYFWLLPTYRAQLLLLKKETSKELTITALELIADYHRRWESGELTLEEAQTRAKRRIESLRYGKEKKNYFWIFSSDGVLLMHPYRKDLEGKNVYLLL